MLISIIVMIVCGICLFKDIDRFSNEVVRIVDEKRNGRIYDYENTDHVVRIYH